MFERQKVPPSVGVRLEVLSYHALQRRNDVLASVLPLTNRAPQRDMLKRLRDGHAGCGALPANVEDDRLLGEQPHASLGVLGFG